MKDHWREVFDLVVSHFRDIRKLKTFIRKSLTENLTLKLISIIITLTLFIIIAGESVQVSKSIKIEYVTAEDSIIVNNVPFEFEVILSGPKSAVGSARARDLLYKIDLTGAQEGTSRIRINHRQLGLPRGVIVSSVMPSIVYPRVEKVITKKVPVVFEAHGSSKKVVILSTQMEPEEITISGPTTHLQNITRVYTESFDLSSVSKSNRYAVTLKIPDSRIRVVDPKEDSIRVNIKVETAKKGL